MDHGMDQISEVISPGGADQVLIERQNALHAYAISECAEFVFGFVPRSQINRINGRKNTLRLVSKTTFGSKATSLQPHSHWSETPGPRCSSLRTEIRSKPFLDHDGIRCIQGQYEDQLKSWEKSIGRTHAQLYVPE
jgi:hypothetical protein